jgi:hypothetical protein
MLRENMELGLYPTLGILVLAIGLFVLAGNRARQPSEPLKVRLVNYHYVQFFFVVLALVMIAHLLTILAGHPVTGQGMRR